MKFTPLQLAIAECANYNPDNCQNINIQDDLTLVRANFTTKKCALPEARCRYFEECVIPTADLQRDERKSKAYKEAAYIYRMKWLC